MSTSSNTSIGKNYISKKKIVSLGSHLKPRPLGNPISEEDGVLSNAKKFLNAVHNGKWSVAKEIYDKNPGVLKVTCLNYGKSALHIAVIAEHIDIVEWLIGKMEPKDLELRGTIDGFTALADATMSGIISIAKSMVRKNPRIVSIATETGMIPVVLALAYGNKKMARYLYEVTPLEELLPEKGANGASLLTYAIRMQQYDIAFHLLKRCPRLAFASDHRDRSPLFELGCSSPAILSGSKLRFWHHWLYKCIYLQQHEYAKYNVDFRIDVRDDSPKNKRNITCSGILQLLASKLLQLLGLLHIYEMKLVHHHSFKLLGLISQEMKALDQKMVNTLCEALWEATARGNVEFFISVLQMVPELIWHQNEKGSTIFMHAIEFRQPKIFSLIHGFGSKQAMVAETDNFGNSMLHVAGLLAPSNQLNRIQVAALQMQRELQWFKEVERIISPDHLESKNNESKTPCESFTENHRRLMKDAEEWMKGTASSCTVVGALIVTVMFSVAFTVPGGNNQDTGIPLFLGQKTFTIFIILDAISLFSSIASVLMFLGILTSRYAEEDFLKSLPTKMIIGLSTLLLSLATMTTAFCVALLIMFPRDLWVKNSVIILACLPTSLFIWIQFPLLFDMFIYTYGPSIFYRKVERWLIS